MTSLGWQGYELSKQLTLGVGIGIGIGLVLRRHLQHRSEQRMKLHDSLERLIEEVKTLSENIIFMKEFYNENDRPEENVNFEVKIDSDSNDNDDDDLYEMAPSETDDEAAQSAEKDLLKRGTKSLNEEFYRKVDALLEGNDQDKEEAYKLLQDQTSLSPRNPQLLWRYAMAQYQIAVRRGATGDREGKKQLIQSGVEVAKESLKLNDSNAHAHRWYAILEGVNIEYLPTEEKIKKGYVYKEHIEKAIQLDPNEATAYSLLGRWCYEVYMMPWYLRKVAAALFSEPPSSTIEEALGNFMKAEELKPGFWKMNSFYIGQCHYQNSDYSKAKEWFVKAKNLPIDSPEDEDVQIQINTMLGRV